MCRKKKKEKFGSVIHFSLDSKEDKKVVVNND